MAEDQGKEEEKFGFTGEGEAVAIFPLPRLVSWPCRRQGNPG